MRPRRQRRLGGGVGGFEIDLEGGNVVGPEADDGTVVDPGEADLGEGTDAAGQRDDHVAVQRDERVPGVAETGRDGDVDIVVGGSGALAGEDTDRGSALGLRAATDRCHRPAATAADDDVTASREFAADRFRAGCLFVRDRPAADDASAHTRDAVGGDNDRFGLESRATRAKVSVGSRGEAVSGRPSGRAYCGPRSARWNTTVVEIFIAESVRSQRFRRI